LHELELMVEVEVVERLVQQQDRGLLGQGLGDQGPLALTAGQLDDQTVCEGGHPGGLEGGRDGFAVGGRSILGVAAHGHHLLHGEGEIEVELLGHHSREPGQFARTVFGDGPLVQKDLSGRGLYLSGQRPKQRGLARPIRSQDPQERTPLHLQVEGPKHALPAQADFERAGLIHQRRHLVSHPVPHLVHDGVRSLISPCAPAAGTGRRARRRPP